MAANPVRRTRWTLTLTAAAAAATTASLSLLPQTASAQEIKTDKPTPAPAIPAQAPKTPTLTPTPTPTPPVLGNPLVTPELAKPPVEPKARDAAGQPAPPLPDYRAASESPTSQDRTRKLKAFGYAFFDPARQIIDTRREFLRSRYGSDPKTSPKSEIKIDPRTDPRTDPKIEKTGEKADPVNAFQDVADPLTQLYRNVTASIPAGYQLAPGDSLTVRYWSATRPAREFTRTVDAQGAVTLDGDAGRIIVRGLTTAQAEATLRTRLGKLYKKADASVTLRELRTIPVLVSGEAYAPGTYVVPAVATAFNVLYAAGGPTEAGSLRRIEVRRRGRLVGTLDLYRFLAAGTAPGKSAAAAAANDDDDIALQPGDQILIPARLSRVAVDGEVRTPAFFELGDEETLQDALRYAGGVKPSGVDQRVQISTVAPGSARVLKDVDLRQKNSPASIALYDGDVIDVFSVRQTVMNRVSIEGAVDQPGDYALIENMRVADLVQRARGPLGEAYLTRADLYRWNPDNTLTLVPIDLEKALAGDPAANVSLTRWDRLKIYARGDVAWTGKREVTVKGAVQRPGVYTRSTNMTVRDLLLAAGGPTPDAYLERATLLRQRGDGSFRYEYVKVNDAVQNLPLEDNDVLALYKVGEAKFTADRVVTILGEVVTPGPYPRGDGMKLSELVQLAGGLKPGAGSRVTVAKARRNAADNGTAVVDVNSNGTPVALTDTIQVTLDSQGRCPTADADVTLDDGDVVTIQGTGGFRDRVQTVTIRGAVNRPGPVVIRTNGMRLSDALREAGGLRPEAYPEGLEFVRSPHLLASRGQLEMADTISKLSDQLNASTFQREQAKSDIERMKALGATAQPDAPSPLAALGAVTGQNGNGSGATPAASGPVAAETQVANQLSKRDLVSAPRVLGDDALIPNGSIAVDLDGALRRPGGADDILLVDGDTITIPERPSTIQVVGAVLNTRGVLWKPGANLDFYVSNCGGLTPDAARDRIVVIRAGGGLLPASKVRELKAGDVVVVPTRVLAERLSTKKADIDGIFSKITSSALVFKLATSLFGK